MEQVSWHDAVEFCQRLSKHTGKEYRLPREAKWEYACRAGTQTPFHFGETLSAEVANYDAERTYGSGLKGRCREQTTKVDCFSANAYGLYDMHGNVSEWCSDHLNNYAQMLNDGSAFVTSEEKPLVVRGGSYFLNPRNCRSASRSNYMPTYCYYDIGFRVSCSAPNI
ncbi:MAG: formylglycine-generating enzyme family protein [Cyanobacteria bacterium P01_D01_bin.1]